MPANIILIISSIILVLLGLAVFVSNPKRLVNRALTAFLLSGLAWVLANLLANLSTSKGSALFFSRATLIGGVLSPLTLLIFVTAYTGFRKINTGYLAAVS